jgi:glycolate oxidase FAD binding subunit
LGVLVEATFKVFPRPETFTSVRVAVGSVAQGAALLRKLATAPQEFQSVDLVAGEDPAVWIRLGGAYSTLGERLARTTSSLGGGEAVEQEDEHAFWEVQRSFGWAPPGWLLAMAPTDPHRLVTLDRALHTLDAQRRYSVGGHVTWFACDRDSQVVGDVLMQSGASGLLLCGDGPSPLIGAWQSGEVLRRVRGVLDPASKFLEF